jgi:UDP-N-acetylglucosamine--N-acetylmuramyl-(pentapeptide) pyrophosphoryl-undecaprenol N-acetylglucosamine transferase
LRRHKPQKIISTGGYIALPVCLTATLLRIPIELYELNALPGMATRALAPLATTISCCFKEAFPFFAKKKVRYAPYPIRFTPSIHQPTLPAHFSVDRKTILVIGGSQGSHFINTAITTWLAQTTCIATVQIIHQTGIAHLQTCRDFYALHNIPALVFDYDDRIEQYYRCADLVICRSGAGSLFETLFFNKPCITIPLETKSTDHHIYNARACVRTHPNLFNIIEQKKLAEEPLLLDNFVQSL